jgi:hypothetical protein
MRKFTTALAFCGRTLGAGLPFDIVTAVVVRIIEATGGIFEQTFVIRGLRTGKLLITHLTGYVVFLPISLNKEYS